jgi:hypothetical protein
VSKQYIRNYTLAIIGEDGQTRIISGLRIQFEVQKFIYGRANTCALKIYNASEDTLSLLEKKFTKIILNAGYGTDLSLLFSGDVRNVFQRRDSVDSILEVYAADGEVPLLNSIFNKSYEGSVDIKQIITEVAGSFKDVVLGVVSGLPEGADKLLGQSLSGSSKDIMDTYAQEYGFNWSIDDGVLNIISEESAIALTNVILVTSKTGMIGSPTITDIGVDVTTLLNTEFSPNRLFRIQSVGAELQVGNLFVGKAKRTVAEGTYKVTECLFKGDSRDGQWVSIVKGRPFNVGG